MNPKTPVLFTQKADCCGCAACEAICPLGAIRMVLDEDGFYYPFLDEEKCINCRKCVTVCGFKSCP